MTRARFSGAVAASAAAIYLAFPAARYNFDGVACAIAVELGDLKHLVHGNHLAYAAFGYFFFLLLRFLRIPIPALQSLQIFSSLLGAAGIGGFAWLLLECGISPAIAAAGAIGLAVSKIYWIWSLEAQVFPLGAAFLMFAAAEAFRKKPDPIRLGLLHAGAILGHVGHLMFFPAAAYLLWTAESHSREPRRAPSPAHRAGEGHSHSLSVRVRALLTYAVVLAGTTFVAYALASFWVQPHSFEDVRIWLLGSAALGVDRAFSWHGGYSFPGLLAWLRISLELAGIGIWGGGALIAAAVWGGWLSWKRDRRIVFGGIVWLVGYAALFLSWEPYTPDYRITDLAPLWLLACLGLQAWKAPTRLRAALVAVAVVLLGAANFAHEIYPASKPENNADLQRALWVGKNTPPDAWIIVDGIDQVYTPYFADRPFVNLRYYSGQPENLENRVRALESAGSRVFVVPEVVPAEWRQWLHGKPAKVVSTNTPWTLVEVLPQQFQ